jgi:hypothetical protein
MSASPIERKKAQYRYTPAMQRPRCGNCTHERGGHTNYPQQCWALGCMVSDWAVCDLHQFKAPAAAATPAPGTQLSP